MNLSAFIIANMAHILSEWEVFAKTLMPSGMDQLALRDHAQEILEAIAHDMLIQQSDRQSEEKSKGAEDSHGNTETPAAIHGALRHTSGFDLKQLFAEYRALRASVLRLWAEAGDDASSSAFDEMTRFNEAIDQALAESVSRYSDHVGKSRDTFIAILGHDLRNPLQAISMSAAALSQTDLAPGTRRDAVGRIQSSALAMSHMIRDLLEYTRTRLGKAIPINIERTDVEAVLRDSLAEMQAGNPQRSFRFEAESDLAAFVDGPRLQQAVGNLLGNAVQYGSPGSTVKLVVRSDGDELVIEVTNDGERIPDESLQAIFDPLVQLGDPSSPRDGNLGLGLFIAREISEGHGGGIGVVSTDRSTTFTIRIPRNAQGLALKPRQQASATMPPVTG